MQLHGWTTLDGTEQLSTPDHSLGEESDDEEKDELVTPTKRPTLAAVTPRKRKSPSITRPIVAKRQKQFPNTTAKNPWLSSDDELELPRRIPFKSKKACIASNRKRSSEDSASVAKKTTNIGTIEITSSEDECRPVKKEMINLGTIDISSDEELPAVKFREEGGICVLLSSEDEEQLPLKEPTEPPSSTETTPVAPPFPSPPLLRDADEDASITPTKDDPFPTIDPPSPTLNNDASFPATKPPVSSSLTALGTTVIFAKALLSIALTYIRRPPLTKGQSVFLLIKHTNQTGMMAETPKEAEEDRKQMLIDLVAGLLASKNAKYKWVREET